MTDENTGTESESAMFATHFKKALLPMLAVCLLCALYITSCACILNSFNDPSSSSSSAAYDENDEDSEDDDEDSEDDDDYSSYSSSSSSSSSSTLLDEDDWVGTDYIDTDGEYAIHKNADGTGAIADGNGNKAVDNDGDGKLDSYSTDNGKTWNSLQ